MDYLLSNLWFIFQPSLNHSLDQLQTGNCDLNHIIINIFNWGIFDHSYNQLIPMLSSSFASPRYKK